MALCDNISIRYIFKARDYNMHNPSLHLFYGVTHVMMLHAHPLPLPSCCFSCHHHWFCLHILHLVPVLFSIVIPTSFNILMKCFSHLSHLLCMHMVGVYVGFEGLMTIHKLSPKWRSVHLCISTLAAEW